MTQHGLNRPVNLVFTGEGTDAFLSHVWSVDMGDSRVVVM
jgi:hypothetical protein